ncbi:response regulator transcription factor [Stakelama sp. CBK3Z-3]|uniref:Response regulator transcription factor n=1 Tax=Stakelama flava TaxID=2860338 RepID=A0ABS6XIV3_9SPHN|nr:response regulator transcription factor [Stakelama flava]MBW4329758.1 response regulator transcription factor [Stakelama flava]
MARIISVEDDELIGAALVMALGAEGHLVGVINNGALALETIRFKRPDLVILDRALPGMPGIEVLKRLRQDPHTYMLPVIMLTGHRRESDLDSAFEAGVNEYLTKPFDAAQLVATVDRVLRFSPLRPAPLLSTAEDEPPVETPAPLFSDDGS